MGKGIAFAGTIVHDRIYGISEYPTSGSLTRISEVDNSVGGLVPNCAIDMKKLRKSVPVYALGRVGDDASADFCLGTMEKNGVDTSMVSRHKDAITGFTNVMSIVGGQRTFFTYSGANDEFSYGDIPWDTLSVDFLHLGYFLLLEKVDTGEGLRILKEAKARGIKTSIDLVSESAEKYRAVLPCLPYVDNIIVNELEAGALTGISPTEDNLQSLAEKLLSLGVRERVIIHSPTLGVLASSRGITALPSYKLPEGFIKGTAGAGDAFCTGALLAIYEGREDFEILEFATLAATSSLRKSGATESVEDIDYLREKFSSFERR